MEYAIIYLAKQGQCKIKVAACHSEEVEEKIKELCIKTRKEEKDFTVEYTDRLLFQ